MNNNQTSYVPILKAKAGELGALRELKDTTKERVLPILEVPPIPWDFESNKEKKTLDDHIFAIPALIEKNWGSERKLFLDLFHIQNDIMGDGRHSLVGLVEKCAELGIQCSPVTFLSATTDYIKAASEVLENFNCGACVRIKENDLGAIKRDPSCIFDCLTNLNVSPSEVDVIVDFGFVGSFSPTMVEEAIVQFVNALPRIDEWKTVSVASTSMPSNVSGISAGSIESIQRPEFNVWKNVRSRCNRFPIFSDYGFRNPAHIQLDMKKISMSGKIWYTLEREWLFVKGKLVSRAGFSQYHELAAELVRHPGYSGKDFSWGDNYIYDCATKNTTSGNSQTWVKIGTNHHIEFVTNQLSSLDDSLASS